MNTSAQVVGQRQEILGERERSGKEAQYRLNGSVS